MFKQYIKFLCTGGLLGVAALVLHALIYRLIGDESGGAYALASVITYIPLIMLNFLIQQSMIFSEAGRFGRFILANLIIMAFVSTISPFCRDGITTIAGSQVGDNTGFILAALIGATPSFLLARFWVFVASERSV